MSEKKREREDKKDENLNKKTKSEWDEEEEINDKKPSSFDETPKASENSRFSETPRGNQTPLGGQTPTTRKSRWDVTPTVNSTSQLGQNTPKVPSTPKEYQQVKMDKELEERNKYLTDEDLDTMLPSEGYVILKPPKNYIPPTPSRKLLATPKQEDSGFYSIPEEKKEDYGIVLTNGQELPNIIKPEDIKHFGKLLEEVDEDLITKEEIRERRIMELLLQIKNGTPQQRKKSLRVITERAREFGAGPLFNQILPILMSRTIDDQERHLLVKVIDRILYKLDDLVRPYVHKIMLVISPLLIDEDYYARIEGREIISNLSKAAGLATMISTLRPDIDNVDEYVRNTTARAFAVVASALGIPQLLPFLKAVCSSKKSWQAKHTGIKIIQQIAILCGVGILPYLKQMIDIIENGLKDNEGKVRVMTALAISALAEASAPYGIESFENVLKPLWVGIQKQKGKPLAAFLKAVGFIIPLMDKENAAIYTRNIIDVVVREFSNQDDEMRKILLKVVKQIVTTEGIEPIFIKEKILSSYFDHFWERKMSLDKRNSKPLIETTVALANNVGGVEVVKRIVKDLKNESEPFRKMTLETIQQICKALGVSDINQRLEVELVDGILYSFQELSEDDNYHITINAFGDILDSLGSRSKIYIPTISSSIKWKLNYKSPKIRQQAADLIAKTALVMKKSDEDQTLTSFGSILYEHLGEEYPDVLASIINGISQIVDALGMEKMNPPIKDLLPRLTPILQNRHEKVQENCIKLIGKIANKAPEHVSPKEWMRICFDLLDVLKAHRKSIRRAAINTFGYISKSIGPHDVLLTLLSNLKVQERQNRVSTTIAIAIVAENCGVFTVLPALMNEYRVPELNVKTGVLKSLSFMFEYIGEMAKDYIYAVTPLLEDALMDRDLVHRQTACTVIKHLALGVYGLGCDDVLMHLLNLVWPNIFETSPHVINAVMEAVEGLRVGLGAPYIMSYTVQGLFHPARKVRNIYWKVFNNLYIGNADAIVPSYPRIPNDKENHYERDELMMIL